MIPGTPHFPADLDVQYSRIHLGMAWPAVRPGYAVVVGEDRVGFVGGRPRLTVLDEASDPRLWHIVERAAALWFYYRPERVWTDTGHVAALQFCAERAVSGFGVEHSLLCAMEGPCAYAFPVLQRLLATERLVIPPASALQGELLVAPVQIDPAKLLLSDYPALAALAFAVLGLEQTREDRRTARPGSAQIGRALE
jgi:hypothetical protein